VANVESINSSSKLTLIVANSEKTVSDFYLKELKKGGENYQPKCPRE
jgi:hypothetical protein